jgi:hypothetical protein
MKRAYVLQQILTEITVFWEVRMCSLVDGHQGFVEASFLHLQCRGDGLLSLKL